MHLSFLSDAYFSDMFEDTATQTFEPARPDASLHLQGLVRGLVFLCVLAVPLAFATAPTWLHPEDVTSDLGFGPSNGAISTADRR